MLKLCLITFSGNELTKHKKLSFLFVLLMSKLAIALPGPTIYVNQYSLTMLKMAVNTTTLFIPLDLFKYSFFGCQEKETSVNEARPMRPQF